MTIPDFIAQMTNTLPPASEADIAALETSIGARLPSDYRDFLLMVNGGFISKGVWYRGANPVGRQIEGGVDLIGGLRRESHYSLVENRADYQSEDDMRIPRDLLWIMGDPFGNAICLGILPPQEGKIYYWNHENEFHDEDYDGTASTARNLCLLANSFTDFIGILRPPAPEPEVSQKKFLP